jgi:hypothetical protein
VLAEAGDGDTRDLGGADREVERERGFDSPTLGQLLDVLEARL